VKVDLSTDRGYTLATALRGPDAAYTTLKWIITGWLRSKCGVSEAQCIVRPRRLDAGSIARARREVEDLRENKSLYGPTLHWLIHSRDAINRVGEFDLEGRWLVDFIQALVFMLRIPSDETQAQVFRLLYAYSERLKWGGEKEC